MNNKVFLNNKICNIEEAKISIFDRGFLFSDGVYELIPFFNKKPFLFEEHYKRLENSLKMLDLDNPYSKDEWLDKIKMLLNYCEYDNFSLYIQITRGEPLSYNDGVFREHAAIKKYKTSVSMFFSKINDLSESFIRCETAITLEDKRWMQCDIKSISLLYNSYAKTLASKKGAYEAILFRNGVLTEGCSSNVFIVKNKKIITPKLSNLILHGITRSYIINEIIKKNKFEIVIEDINEEDLFSSDEVFITNSTQGVLPIIKINNKKINKGTCGEISKKLHQLYLKKIN